MKRRALLVNGLIGACAVAAGATGCTSPHAKKMALSAQGPRLAFSPDGTTLAAIVRDVSLFNVDSGALKRTLPVRLSQNGVAPVFGTWGPWMGLLGVGGGGPIVLVDSDGVARVTLPGTAQSRHVFAFAGATALVRATSRDGDQRIDVVELARADAPAAGALPFSGAGDGATSPNGRYAVFSSQQGVVLVDGERPQEPRILDPHPSSTAGKAFSTDGALVASGAGGAVGVWETASGRAVAHIPCARNGGRPVGFVGSDLIVVDGGFDISRVALTGEQGAAVWTLPQSADDGGRHARALAPAADALVVYVEKPGALRVVDTNTGKLRATLGKAGEYGWQALVQQMASAPDGRRVAAEHHSRIHVWDVVSERMVELFDPALPDLR